MSVDTDRRAYTASTPIIDAFYRLSERVFDADGDFAAGVERKLAEARMSHTVELYLARALAIGVLCGGTLWIIGTGLGYVLVSTFIEGTPSFFGLVLPSKEVLSVIQALKIPFLIVSSGIALGVFGFALGFGTYVAIPYSKARGRKREIEMLLPDSISFMYALSVGGLNQLEILEAMARADDTYGETAKEFQSIVLETEYFDTDYRSAIRNQALTTPSEELSQFLTDMLSIVNSGGDMTKFLDDQKEKHLRTAKQQQELTLETLELFGEMYMTLSLFPLLLIIILVIMGMMGQARTSMLYGTVYGLIPLIGVAFLVMVSTVTHDEPGDGYLEGNSDRRGAASTGISDLGAIEGYTGEYGVFDRIERREGTYETLRLLKRPHVFFRDHPLYVLALSVPAALVALAVAVLSGSAPLSLSGFVDNPVGATVLWLYVPLYVSLLPLAIFHEWNVRSRRKVVGNLSDSLRKLSSANDTGMTLLESLAVVADTSSGKLAEEFETIHAKVDYGTSMRAALIEFNNRYHIPRLARTIKLVTKAQEASNRITAVLSTAAQTSENQDDIERERLSRARMQIVIIVMTYLTLLGVMALLQVNFLDTMAELAEQSAGASSGGSGAAGAASFGSGVDTDMLGMLFFHAVTLQAVISGLISGYMSEGSLLAGVKYAVVLPAFALIVFSVI